MLYLLGGLAILLGLLLLGYLFVNANPARLAKSIKWGGIRLAAAAALGLVILTEGRIIMWLLPLGAIALPAVRRFRSLWSGMRGGPASSGSSTVETGFIRMTLDHDTGAMTGTVLRGHFAGMRVEE